MTIDRYTKAVLTVIAVALTLIAARPWLGESGWLSAFRPAPAQAQAQGMVAKWGEITIPKTWGKLVSYSNNNLLLEAPDRSMRIVDVEGKAPEYPKLKLVLRWE